MIDLFLDILAFAGIICTLLGLFVLFKTLVQPKRPPMDSSNRLNHLRLVWFTLNAPHDAVELYRYDPEDPKGPYVQAFPWLERDEGDNV